MDSLKINIALIPPDTRPHTLDLPLQVCKILGFTVFTPPKEALPNFNTPGNTQVLHKWLTELVNSRKIDAIIVSLETLTLGGMIPARRVDDSEKEVLSRLEILEKIRAEFKDMQIFAHGTIVRVAHGNDPYEEKEYYEKYGDLLRNYSVLADKNSRGDETIKKELEELVSKIPKEILTNYLNTRKRNTNMHIKAIQYLSKNVINYLALTLDDTAPYGLAAIDRRLLESKIDELKLWDNADIYPGADELPSVLISRFAIKKFNKNIKIHFIYNSVCGPITTLIYEDRPLGEVLKAHRRAVSLHEIHNPENADLIIAVNNAGKHQGEAFAQPNFEDVENASRHLPDFIDQIDYFIKNGKKVVILDTAYANGCDHRFMNLLLSKIDITKITAISGWNTAGNSIGSGLALGAASLIGETNKNEILEALFTRVIDDWLYQGKLRQKIYENLGKPSVFHLGDKCELAQKMVGEELRPEMERVWKLYFEPHLKDLKLNIGKIYLPWPRLFSVTMDLNISKK